MSSKMLAGILDGMYIGVLLFSQSKLNFTIGNIAHGFDPCTVLTFIEFIINNYYSIENIVAGFNPVTSFGSTSVGYSFVVVKVKLDEVPNALGVGRRRFTLGSNGRVPRRGKACFVGAKFTPCDSLIPYPTGIANIGV